MESGHDSAATYQIVVRGRLDESWSARLSDMTISAASGAGSEVTTILCGTLSDQAALAGVLNTLYDLGLTLVSVSSLSTRCSR